jgi:hypothetical protein
MRWLLALALAACSPGKDSPAAAAPGGAASPNFELACVAANTSTAAQMQCLRTDTRTGEVLLVDYMRLPVTPGSSALESGPPGRYTTSCAAPSSAQRADLYCVRLNTSSGDMLLVNLTKVGTLPPSK